MILSLLRNGFSINVLIGLCASAFVVFCTMPVHEYAHALVATKLGDDTAKRNGRLTLNPMAHIDVIGALMILLVGFGYAKAVPVNPRNFKNPKTGMALTAAAGPLANLIMSAMFILLSNLAFIVYCNTNDSIVAQVTFMFFFYAAMINVNLAVFNLIPIPPLDGSRIIGIFIPNKVYYKIMQYERYIIIAVFLMIMFGLLDRPLSWASDKVMKGIMWLFSKPFGSYGDAFFSAFSSIL
ncbi:MAG: site-2 protease family protein [Acutalibacteraceae bacterium]